ncbi:MAG: FAD:protein FMN transferase [Myxococcales bacterium]|nr:FAD:protein FMN transferase [Myxococcales bacterium]MCB9651139.1 FAD:protein FMN transferase [Deltaproteobacteria bacterium]
MRPAPLLLGLVVGLAACTKPAAADKPAEATAAKPKELLHRSHHAMGTQITITAYTDAPGTFESACKAAFDEFDRLEALLTVWRNDSDVSKVNAQAGKAAVKVGPETLRAVQVALRLAKATDGKFDVTFGALAGLWRFDHDQDDKIPTEAEIAARLPLVGWEMVEVDEAASTVKLAKPGVKLHLGGIGKGFAVDAAVALLKQAGLKDFMVQAGGDLYVSGRRGDRPWRVGIRDPRGERDAFFAAAEVEDGTFSTSGDYERSFVHDGVRYHHILDPDLGRPARGVRSVTVMAKDAVTADALSTGVFILGVKRGLEVVEGMDGVGAVIVDDQNKVHISSRLQGRVKVFRDPTDGL